MAAVVNLKSPAMQTASRGLAQMETTRAGAEPTAIPPNMVARVVGSAVTPAKRELTGADRYMARGRAEVEDQDRAETVALAEPGRVTPMAAVGLAEHRAQVQRDQVEILDVETGSAAEMARAGTVGPVESQEEAVVALVVMLVKRAALVGLVFAASGPGNGIQGHSRDRRTVGSPGRRCCVGDHIPATLGERLPGIKR